MTDDVHYWLRGEPIQNYGDFLSAFFMRHLFFPCAEPGRVVRLVGSCLDDMFLIPGAAAGENYGTPEQPMIFWGCGLRQEDGLSDQHRNAAEIMAVRGPLTRSALRLGEAVPMGDPGLLLPALHRAAGLWRPQGRTLLVPHFHDHRPDRELLLATGCDAVLRPNLPNDPGAITDFIDELVAADFVLAGSMHAAITAAAYGRPFAFWDSGRIDLPFKWQDFAASVQMPCVFQKTLESARAHWENDIRPRLRLPVLWPLLVAAPFPVRPDAFIAIVDLDIQRHGVEALRHGVSSRATNRLQSTLDGLIGATAEAVSLRREVARLGAAGAEMREEAARQRAQEVALAAELVARETARQRLDAELAQRETRLEHLEAESARLQAALAESEAEGARLQAATAESEAAQTRLQAELAATEAARDAAARLASQEREAREAVEEWHARESSPPTDPALLRDLAWLREREATLAAEEARLHRAVQERDQANAALREDLARQQAQIDAVTGSALWRLGGPVRRVASRTPRLRRTLRRGAKLAWWGVTMQLGKRVSRRRQLQQELGAIAASPLFDRAFYRAAHPEIGDGDAVVHYVFTGAAQGHAPHPLFDGGWYARGRAEVAASGLTPLGHYLAVGAARGEDPHPLFDAAWYATRYGLPAGSDALAHYVTEGAAQGADPNRLFDSRGYMAEYPAARASGLDAFRHYVLIGAAAGYDPHPLFESAWYRTVYPDAAASGMDPLAHWLHAGEAEGRGTTRLSREIWNFDPKAPPALGHWADPEVSIIIPAYGHYYDTLRCLYAVAAHSGGVSYELILADDNPANPLGPLLGHIENLRIEANPANLGFLRSCNRAAGLATGWQLIFLNNDTIVHPGWLEALVAPVREDSRVGMVGCKLLNADGTVQEAGGTIFRDGWGYSFGAGEEATLPAFNYRRDVDVVVGACFLVRRPLFQKLGGFDDQYAPAFYEEFDLAFAIHDQGSRVVYEPRCVVTHLGSSSYGAEMRDRQSQRNHAKFCVKWAEALRRQPERGDSLFVARQRPNAIGTMLVIDDKVPEYDRHAGALTVFQYVRLMANLGMRVVYAPFDMQPRQPYTAALQKLGVEVLHTPLRLADWLAENGRHVDWIWTARPDVSAGILALLRRTTKARILYYPHDLHYLRELRRYQLEGNTSSLEESQRVRKLELAIFRQVDVVLTCSGEEARIIAEQVPRATVRVVPPYLYPADSAASLPLAAFETRQDILFIGGFNHPPNADAALWLLRDIMPMVWQQVPATKVMIIGENPPPELLALAGERVEIAGHVPDLAPWYARARLTLSPLRYGAGVKGKVVGALQAGIPVVTTSVGNEGIALEHGAAVMIGDTAEALAKSAVALLRDPVLCATLSENGAAVIARRYSEDRGREVLLDALGVAWCRVCGAPMARSSPVCDACGAGDRAQALAEALLRPLRGKGVNSLRAALPLLARHRIHEFGAGDRAVSQVLQDSPLFTASDYFPDVPPGRYGPGMMLCQDLRQLTFRDGEIDLMVSQDVLNGIDELDRVAAETFRVLRPKGRHVFTLDAQADGVAAALARAGFSVTVDQALDNAVVVSAVRPG